jgi:uncharacterized protein (TIGR00369 family)
MTRRSELPWKGIEGYHCFGCCPDNPAGIALRPVEHEDGLACWFTLDRKHESYPGIVHGGVVVTVLDELMGNVLAMLEHKACFTVSLRARFLAPVRSGHTYRAVARVVERPDSPDGLYKVEGEISDADRREVLTAHATYHWMTEDQANTFMTPSPAATEEFAGYFRKAG